MKIINTTISVGELEEMAAAINLYPQTPVPDGDFIEFDSMINVRPSQGNRSRSVEDEGLRHKIVQMVHQRVRP